MPNANVSAERGAIPVSGAHHVSGAAQVNFAPCRRGRPPRPLAVPGYGGGSA